MSVYVTLRVKVDPAAFEAAVAERADVIERIMGIAKGKGLIGHRWLRRDGEIPAIDEWPDAESFQAFFEAGGPDIGPLMAAAGATGEPEVTVWGHLAIDDVFGWGA